MTQEQRSQIASLWSVIAAIYGKDLPVQALKIMLDAVDDLPFMRVMEFLSGWTKTSKHPRHPFPAEIREALNPTISNDAQAREAAARIQQAIGKFGWPNPDQAKEFIGELGWKVVERFGGWLYVCENHGVELNALTFQAQARDLAKAQIEFGMAGRADEAPTLPQPDQKLMGILELAKIKSLP